MAKKRKTDVVEAELERDEVVPTHTNTEHVCDGQSLRDFLDAVIDFADHHERYHNADGPILDTCCWAMRLLEDPDQASMLIAELARRLDERGYDANWQDAIDRERRRVSPIREYFIPSGGRKRN